MMTEREEIRARLLSEIEECFRKAAKHKKKRSEAKSCIPELLTLAATVREELSVLSPLSEEETVAETNEMLLARYRLETALEGLSSLQSEEELIQKFAEKRKKSKTDKKDKKDKKKKEKNRRKK